MKMTKWMSAAFIAAAVTFASCSDSKPAETKPTATGPAILQGDQKLNVDVATSTVHWKGEMLGIYSHEGNVNLTNGSLNLKDGKITSGSFTVDLATMKATDANYNPKEGKTAEALVGHLSSPDFFDVANNPTATFELKSVEGNTGKGILTVRGKSGEETIKDITISAEGETVKVSGKLTFNRQNYGVAYSTGAKDKVLSDDIAIDVNLVAKK